MTICRWSASLGSGLTGISECSTANTEGLGLHPLATGYGSGSRATGCFERLSSMDVHVCDAGSEWERRHLLLRDWLRQSEDDRHASARLKVQLQGQDRETMNHYADAKGALIGEMIARAEVWAASVGWSP